MIRLDIQVRLAQGRRAEALSVIEDALDRPDAQRGRVNADGPRYAWPMLVAGARACATAAAPRDGTLLPRARAMLDRLRAEAAKLAVEGPAQQAHRLTFAAEAARASQALAAIESGESPQPADTRTAWDQAAKAWETAGEPYPLAIALHRYAEAALVAGDRDGGAARLRRAAELARRLGASPLNDEIALLARRARITLSEPGEGADAEAGAAQTGDPSRLGLTARELEVLRLVAAGRSNRDIAAELFISAKTASVHVSNIMAKLGVHTRVEAAAIAHQAGVTGLV